VQTCALPILERPAECPVLHHLADHGIVLSPCMTPRGTRGLDVSDVELPNCENGSQGLFVGRLAGVCRREVLVRSLPVPPDVPELPCERVCDVERMKEAVHHTVEDMRHAV